MKGRFGLNRWIGQSQPGWRWAGAACKILPAPHGRSTEVPAEAQPVAPVTLGRYSEPHHRYRARLPVRRARMEIVPSAARTDTLSMLRW
jgi:hypothetical protein